MNPNEILLTSRQVRDRYGRMSDMCLWRWMKDARLGFPQPIYANRRRFWRLSELEAWEKSRPASNASSEKEAA